VAEHDTVVVNGGGNSGATILIAAVVLIVVLALAWYFFLGPGATQTGNPSDINVEVQLPSAAP
jgi:hypothetical protein